MNPSKYTEWHRTSPASQRAVPYSVWRHMVVKIILALPSGISGMLEGAESKSLGKCDHCKWSDQLSAAKPTYRKDHYDSKWKADVKSGSQTWRQKHH